MWRTRAKTVVLCTLDPNTAVESLRRVRCAGNIFFLSPRGLKNAAVCTLSVPFPSINRCAVWNRSTRRLIIPWWDLTWRRCSKIKDASHPCSPWSCDAPAVSLTRIYLQTWAIKTNTLLLALLCADLRHFPSPRCADFEKVTRKQRLQPSVDILARQLVVGVQLSPIKSN